MRLLSLATLVLPLAACLIQPDFASDAGPVDAGVDGGADAGVSGSMGAALATSSGQTLSLAWNGVDLAQTSIQAEGATGPSTVNIVGENAASGDFRMELDGLVPGEATVGVVSVSYIPPSPSSDLWSCGSASTTACVIGVSISDYDGVTLQGNFQIAFPADANFNTAQLTSGSFSIELP